MSSSHSRVLTTDAKLLELPVFNPGKRSPFLKVTLFFRLVVAELLVIHLLSSVEASLSCILLCVTLRRAEFEVEQKLREILFVDQILPTGSYCDMY